MADVPRHPLERLPEEWAEHVRAWGQPAYRGLQVFQWIHQRGVLDAAAMSNLPRVIRTRLGEELAPIGELTRVSRSSDRTRKLLVRFADGADVETVLIPQLKRIEPDHDEEDWAADRQDGLRPSHVVTQCISSQVGCAMGCVFCASGVAGLSRHLSAAEIVGQVLLARRELEGAEIVRNVVLMGMGEPLHNYENVHRALVLLTHPEGLAISTRRLTLSTSGLVPQIDRLATDFGGRIQLAVSLHAVSDARRSSIMPINRRHSLSELIACLRRYPLPKRRRITIEYTLIAGVNDALEEADQMAALLRGVPAKVNLIPMNPIPESSLDAPGFARVESFRDRLESHGMTATIRRQRGNDVDAACGQLALHGPAGERLPRRRRLPVA